MDTVTTALTTALSAGVAAGLTDLAKKAIADGYNGLKSLLHKKLGENSEVSHAIAGVEAKPDSAGRRATLAEEIEASRIAGDSEILASAQALLKLLESFPGYEQNVQIARGTGIAQAQGGSSASVNISGGTSGGRD